MIWDKGSASNMLWDKESHEKDAPFVDLFGKKKFTIPAPRGALSPKNDRTSQRLRDKGNEHFLQNEYFAAMKLYNQSLCFATNGSELLSYAYSNRSLCFFRLKMYSKCLVDIQLALNSSNCPRKVTQKLTDRKMKCLKSMDEELTYFKPQLSFEPDERFPCMAKVLQIQRNAEFGRQIIATADIPAGKRILAEDGFAAGVFSDPGVNCDICYSSYTNLVPCNNCTKTMFCSGKCDKNDFHFVECGLRWKATTIFDYRYSEVRSILHAIKAFGNVDELMEFATNAVMNDQFDLPVSMSCDKGKYNVFFRNFRSAPGWSDGLLQLIQTVYEGLIGHEFISQRFPTQKHRRFLQHLIGHHLSARGKMTLINVTLQKRFNPLIGLYFNISCTPNATLMFYDNGSQVVTIRPIKSGEQVFVHYMDKDFMVENIGYVQRRAKIQRDFNYLCMCERCVDESSNQIIPELFDDVTRNEVLEILEQGLKYPEKRREATEFVVDLLNKYGRNKWCVDMCTLVCLYNGFIRSEMKFKVPPPEVKRK